MDSQFQVIEMSSLTKEEILCEMIKILSQGSFQIFKLLLKKNTNKRIQPSEQQNQKNKLEEILRTHNHKEKNIKSLNFVDKNYTHQNLEQSFLNLMQQSLLIIEDCTSQKSKKEIALEYYQKGSYQFSLQLFKQIQKDLISSIIYQSQCQQISQIQTYIGHCYFRLHDYSSAIKHYTALTRTECEYPSKIYGQKMNNLGSCYAFLGQDKASMKAYGEALKAYEGCEEVDCSNLLSNIASIYFRSSMFQQAEQYFKESILERKSKSPQLKQSLFYSYHKLALCQKNQQHFRDASKSLDFALELADQGHGDPVEILKIYAQVHQLQQQWPQALAYFDKLSELYERNGLNQAEIYEKVAQIYKKKKMENQFFKYMKLAYEFYQKEDNKRKLSELSTAYNFCAPNNKCGKSSFT